MTVRGPLHRALSSARCSTARRLSFRIPRISGAGAAADRRTCGSRQAWPMHRRLPLSP